MPAVDLPGKNSARAAQAASQSADRIVSAVPTDDDASFELKLRPKWLREFIGQQKVKDQLTVAVTAAKSRGEALDHVLLYGPPGLGKTTLATIIANELAVAYQQTSGPTLQIKGDLTAVLTNLRDKRSEEHTSELQSHSFISYAVFCLKQTHTM